MTKQKYRIEVNQTTCIGNGVCEATDPLHFSVEEGKAMLKNGQLQNNIAVLEKELSDEEAKYAITAAKLCPVNAIRVINLSKNVELVETKVKAETAKVITAVYDDNKDFMLDPNGYFLIRIIPETKEIEVGFCGAKNKVEIIVRGKKPIDIYHTISKLKLISRMEHSSYLGRELQKAFIALQKGIKYVQDDELEV